MAKSERRKSMALDEAYFYCRRLELKLERPALFKVCNALRTVDLALAGAEANQGNEDNGAGSQAYSAKALPSPSGISQQAWSQIRDKLFKVLVTSFPGYFLVYPSNSSEPLEQGQNWPASGTLEFYPEKILRRFETYRCDLDRIEQPVLTVLRWAYSQDRQSVTPSLFSQDFAESETVEQEALEFLDRIYEICEEEAAEGKKKAHRKWCQLYWEANGCPDRRLRHELQKQMLSLQSVWGRPAQLV